MHISKLPKSEVDVIPTDPFKEIKTYTYLLGELYPSKDMAEYLKELKDTAKTNEYYILRKRIYNVVVSMNENEYSRLEGKQLEWMKISGGMTDIIPKENFEFPKQRLHLIGCRIVKAENIDNRWNCELSCDDMREIYE